MTGEISGTPGALIPWPACTVRRLRGNCQKNAGSVPGQEVQRFLVPLHRKVQGGPFGWGEAFFFFCRSAGSVRAAWRGFSVGEVAVRGSGVDRGRCRVFGWAGTVRASGGVCVCHPLCTSIDGADGCYGSMNIHPWILGVEKRSRRSPGLNGIPVYNRSPIVRQYGRSNIVSSPANEGFRAELLYSIR
jgi:hypothetical protein